MAAFRKYTVRLRNLGSITDQHFIDETKMLEMARNDFLYKCTKCDMSKGMYQHH